MAIAVTIYALGVLIGLVVMPDPWLRRVATALVWPLGPAAFVVVLMILLVTAALLWPAVALGVAVIGAVAWIVL